MKKTLKFIGYRESLATKDKFAYIITGLSIFLILAFSIFYVFVVQSFWVNLVSTICLIVLIAALYLLKKELYMFGKSLMILGFLIQEFALVFLWFPKEANFNFFFFAIAPISFFIYDFNIKKERILIVAVNLIATILLLLSETVSLNPLIVLDDWMLKIFTFLSVLSVIVSITVVYYIYARTLNHTLSELNLLANTDSLTRISNRRVLFKQGKELFDISKKYSRDFAVVLIDIDFFKRVNDTYGHLVGDSVLRQLSFLISSNIRKHDIFARYGGEEFALILRDTDLSDNSIVEYLVHTINQYSFKVDENRSINLTISVGVVTFDKVFKSFEDMLLYADKSLYQAKNNGRDQVIQYKIPY